jgi:hypothetical protein
LLVVLHEKANGLTNQLSSHRVQEGNSWLENLSSGKSGKQMFTKQVEPNVTTGVRVIFQKIDLRAYLVVRGFGETFAKDAAQ